MSGHRFWHSSIVSTVYLCKKAEVDFGVQIVSALRN